jgi:lipopolysaccharide export system permease protein
MGRSLNLVGAAFMYMIYSNSLNIVQSFIAQGKLDFWVGLLVPHLVAVAIVAALFGRQLVALGRQLRRDDRPEAA